MGYLESIFLRSVIVGVGEAMSLGTWEITKPSSEKKPIKKTLTRKLLKEHFTNIVLRSTYYFLFTLLHPKINVI